VRRLTPREARLLALLLATLILALYGRYLVLPAYRDLTAARQDYLAARAEYAAVRARLTATPEELASRRDELRRLIPALEGTLPRELDNTVLAPELLALARIQRVQVRALKFGPVTERSPLVVRSATLEVAGGPDDVYAFLKALEGYSRPLSLAGVYLGATQEGLMARVELEFLALPGRPANSATGPPLPPSRMPLRVIRPLEQAAGAGG
jgi:Tfp pilus assembly protein PilO